MKIFNFKKALALTLSAALMLAAAPAVMAADPTLDTKLTYVQTEENIIRVSGSVADAKSAGTLIAAYVTKDELVSLADVVALGTTAAYADGDGTFSVDLIMADNLPSGNYNVTVTARKSIAKAKASFAYVSKADREQLVETLNLPDVTAADVTQTFSTLRGVLDVGTKKSALYTSLSSAAKEKFASYVINRNNGSAPSTLSFSDIDSLVADALVLTAFSCKDNTASSVASIIYNYSDKIGFDTAAEPFAGVSDRANFGEAVLHQDSTENSADMLGIVTESAYLTLINQVNWLGIVSATKKNNSFFEMPESEIKKIESKQAILRAFCEDIKGTYYTLDDYKKAWDKSYKAAVKVNSSTGGGTGGSTGKAKDSVSSDTTTVFVGTNGILSDPLGKKKTINDYYSDMAGYEFEAPYVLTLTEAKIVAGNGEGKFEPARYLKREEFMKLIVNTFGLASVDAQSTFSDVDKNAWYHIYVASAQQKGITQGRGDGSFGIGDYVTREEMLTISYRASQMASLNLPVTNGSVPYTDMTLVSPYAKEAVTALYFGGILTAASNTLAPKGYTSRAEAAVIIAKLYAMKNK